jgi:hypothetical protein
MCDMKRAKFDGHNKKLSATANSQLLLSCMVTYCSYSFNTVAYKYLYNRSFNPIVRA